MLDYEDNNMSSLSLFPFLGEGTIHWLCCLSVIKGSNFVKLYIDL